MINSPFEPGFWVYFTHSQEVLAFFFPFFPRKRPFDPFLRKKEENLSKTLSESKQNKPKTQVLRDT